LLELLQRRGEGGPQLGEDRRRDGPEDGHGGDGGPAWGGAAAPRPQAQEPARRRPPRRAAPRPQFVVVGERQRGGVADAVDRQEAQGDEQLPAQLRDGEDGLDLVHERLPGSPPGWWFNLFSEN